MIQFNQTTKAKKGDLVQIHMIVLEPGERAANLPEETKSVSYEGWIKGFLLEEQAEIGQEVRIETYIGRQLSGVLTEINPVYDHNFGKPQPDINFIGKQAWKKLDGEG
jgi:hypothetical protein